MPCTSPIRAFQCSDRSIVFDEVRKHDIVRSLTLPCRQCDSCRMEYARQWAMRITHEAQLHSSNSFITLTYDDTHLPSDGSLHYEDFQLFLRRWRRSLQRRDGTKIRYYMAGEYGENFGRPHWHACIFGYDFPDKQLWKRTSAGSLIYRSEELEAMWPFGYSSIGDLNYQSAAYVARYVMKKVNGQFQEMHYEDVDFTTGEIIQRKPEFCRMSLKPGIGYEWYKKYRSDVYPHDYVIVNGKKVKPPKFYDNKFKNDYPYEFDELLFAREKSAKLNFLDNTDERLAVKAKVVKARLKHLKRSLT